MVKKISAIRKRDVKSARETWKKEKHNERFLARYGRELKPNERGFIPAGAIF